MWMSRRNKCDEENKTGTFLLCYVVFMIIFFLWLFFGNHPRYEHSTEDRDYGRAVYYGGSWH